jgi:hypothetical protein
LNPEDLKAEACEDRTLNRHTQGTELGLVKGENDNCGEFSEDKDEGEANEEGKLSCHQDEDSVFIMQVSD